MFIHKQLLKRFTFSVYLIHVYVVSNFFCLEPSFPVQTFLSFCLSFMHIIIILLKNFDFLPLYLLVILPTTQSVASISNPYLLSLSHSSTFLYHTSPNLSAGT